MARPKGQSVDIAFSKICEKIEHYILKPMDIVSEIELSEEFNMSRTPVREAIYRLFDYGLVMRDGTRTVVKPIKIKDVVEILQVREACELMAVKIIIHNGGLTDKQKQNLADIQSNLAKSVSIGDLNKNYQTDELFHKTLVSYCHNERLEEIIDKLDVQGQRLRWLTSLTPRRYDSTCKEHENILVAIEKFNLENAENAVKKHIENTKQNYENILQENQWSNIINTLNQL